MVNKLKTLLLLCAFCCATGTFAQLQMGGWQTFFNYNNVSQIVDSKEKIFALSDGNLFSVDKDFESIETYTKLNGLSDGNITLISYCANQDALVIVYDNCNIDILKGYQVVNVPALKLSDMGSKKVNSITVEGKYAYFACGFGIMILDVEREEVTDTYIIGNKGEYLTVSEIAFTNDSIYAHTTNDIRYASRKDNNLADFSHWNIMDIPSETKTEDIKKILSFDNSLILLTTEKAYKRNVGEFEFLFDTNNGDLIVSNQQLLLLNDSMYAYDNNYNLVLSMPAESITQVVYDKQNKNYWTSNAQADGQKLLHKYNQEGVVKNYYIPKGPFSSTMAFAKYEGGKLFTGSGGPFDMPMNSPGVVQIYENNDWSIITEVGMDSTIIADFPFTDVLDIATDPKDSNHFFVASWKGIFEFQGTELVNHHSHKNSSLSDYWVMVITDGLHFDKEGNLWVANMLSPNPINIYTTDKKWVGLSYPELQDKESIKEVMIDSKGYLWVLLPRKGQGVFCADLNNTILNYRDDKTTFLSTLHDKDGHSLSPTTFRCITEDQDGVIWIGTDLGPMLITDRTKVFNSNFIIDRIKITREDNANYADYLLENVQINAIAIDGSNRKWIATNTDGLYLLSADGKETIHHFTTENSPFTSNAIMDLAINNKSGELYIVTSNALFLYKTDATVSAETYKEVFVYPNPVKENFEGDVTINGLMENSLVRISDSEGRIIHQGHSNGGTFVWNGRTISGKRVDTGVYFIYASQDDGSSKMVTKIAFIK